MSFDPTKPKRQLKNHRLCKVCQAIAINPKLKVRIYASTYYNENGSESLADIARDYEGAFTDAGLRNHCRKHQLGSRRSTKIGELMKLKSRLRTEAELEQQLKDSGRITMVPRENYEELWDAVMEAGADRIRKGELRVTGPMMLKAAKDKADYQSKGKDRNLEVAKMMYNFASGEETIVTEETDEPTPQLAAGGTGGQERPGSVYHEAFGYAAALGSADVPAPDAGAPHPH